MQGHLIPMLLLDTDSLTALAVATNKLSNISFFKKKEEKKGILKIHPNLKCILRHSYLYSEIIFLGGRSIIDLFLIDV